MPREIFQLIAVLAAGLLGSGIAFLVAALGDGDALVGLIIVSGLVAAMAFLQAWRVDSEGAP